MSDISKSIRQQVLLKYNCCQICGYQSQSKYIWFEIDHIIPKRFGGTNDINNLTLLCNICNVKKGSLYGSHIDKKIEILYDKINFLQTVKKMQEGINGKEQTPK